MEICRFSVWVTIDGNPFEDHGVLLLPAGYSKDSGATRLVINCHGAGGTVTTDDSQAESQALTKYLVANGYAVMDVNGLPYTYAQQQGIDIRNNIGCPIATECYVAAYHHCIRNYNLYPEVLIHGGSMGGISSTNLVLSGRIPVLAHSAFCPVLDTYGQIYLHPWSDGLPKTALGKLYGLSKDGRGEYIYEEDKIAGHNPMMHPSSARYPVPVKFWHCADDGVVSCHTTQEFVRRIRQNGGEAHLVLLPFGGHEPQLVGEALACPAGRTALDDEEIAVTQTVEDAFLWLRDHDPAK